LYKSRILLSFNTNGLIKIHYEKEIMARSLR